MGYLSALDFASNADLYSALHWHLTANHFPPLPVGLIEPASEAIAAVLDDDWDKPIDLRGFGEYQGKPSAPAAACIEAWHLGAFIDAATEEVEAHDRGEHEETAHGSCPRCSEITEEV